MTTQKRKREKERVYKKRKKRNEINKHAPQTAHNAQ